VFVPKKSFQPSLMLVDKAKSLTREKHISGAPLKSRLLALRTNIRLGWKSLPGSNTLAYNEKSLIVDKKSLIILKPGPNVIKHFLPVIYGFAY
jgi:hypothetical protein